MSVDSVDLDSYIDLMERMAADPDEPVSYADSVLLRRYAVAGAAVGFRERAPIMVSVDAEFLKKVR